MGAYGQRGPNPLVEAGASESGAQGSAFVQTSLPGGKANTGSGRDNEDLRGKCIYVKTPGYQTATCRHCQKRDLDKL